jgi:proteasome lid subunit RPN8/RPN11
MKIKIKEIRQKAEKSRLPGKISKSYPPKTLAVFVSSSVLELLSGFTRTDLHNELGGVLIGRIGKASRRMFIEIQNFIPASKGISHRASFEFTNEAQQEVHEILHSKFPEMKILGWFHTHPGYGIFLSSADQFIDEHYFKEPYHIAMVLDPTSEEIEIGIFVWDPEKNRIRVPFFETN